MTHLSSEGKINENAYMIEGMLWGMAGTLSLYVIEHKGIRMLIDTGEENNARRIVSKLKNLNIYPIHKILLSHSHWDHVAGVQKLSNLMNENPIEVLASEKAINNLKHPEKLNKIYEQQVKPIENVTPLKEGDVIDLNGLKLEVFNFFGHTQDSIAIFDKKNKIIYAGDAIIDKNEPETMTPPFLPPDFNEQALMKTFSKIRKIPAETIAIAHFGVWQGEDYQKILKTMEPTYKMAKDALIEWSQRKLPIDEISKLYREKFFPNSKFYPKDHPEILQMMIEWFIQALNIAGILQ
jgi:hydroxyacylglutathione hydrolase